jgi:hypothetical protein
MSTQIGAHFMTTATRPPRPTVRKTAPTSKPEHEVNDKNDIRVWEAAKATEDPTKVVVPDEQEGERLAEKPPQIPRPTAKSLAKKAVARLKAAPKERTAKPARPRVPVDKLISTAWQMVAQVAQPINMPVARVLDMQAPVAGMILEDSVKGTVIDRVLQPLARVEAGGEVAFALMGPPLLVGALTTRPQLAPVLVPLLRRSLRTWIDIAGDKLERVEKEEKKFEEQYGRRIDEMIAYFLSPMGVEAESENQTQV